MPVVSRAPRLSSNVCRHRIAHWRRWTMSDRQPRPEQDGVGSPIPSCSSARQREAELRGTAHATLLKVTSQERMSPATRRSSWPALVGTGVRGLIVAPQAPKPIEIVFIGFLARLIEERRRRGAAIACSPRFSMIERRRLIAAAIGTMLIPAAGSAQGAPTGSEHINELGPEGTMIAARRGGWDVTETFWAAPGAPPVVSTGLVADRRMIGSLLQEMLHPPADDAGSAVKRLDVLTYNRVVGRWEYAILRHARPGRADAGAELRQRRRARRSSSGSSPSPTRSIPRSRSVRCCGWSKPSPFLAADRDVKDQIFLRADGTGTKWLAHRYAYVRTLLTSRSGTRRRGRWRCGSMGARRSSPGGSRGIGLAIAARMAASGANVAILARRADVLDEARLGIEASAGGRIHAIACDVIEGGRRRRRACGGPARFRTGRHPRQQRRHRSDGRPSHRSPTNVWQADLDLKLFAAIRLARLVWPGMVEQRWGRIVNVLNVPAKAPKAGSAPTSVSPRRRPRPDQGAGGRGSPSRHSRELAPCRADRHRPMGCGGTRDRQRAGPTRTSSPGWQPRSRSAGSAGPRNLPTWRAFSHPISRAM